MVAEALIVIDHGGIDIVIAWGVAGEIDIGRMDWATRSAKHQSTAQAAIIYNLVDFIPQQAHVLRRRRYAGKLLKNTKDKEKEESGERFIILLFLGSIQQPRNARSSRMPSLVIGGSVESLES